MQKIFTWTALASLSCVSGCMSGNDGKSGVAEQYGDDDVPSLDSGDGDILYGDGDGDGYYSGTGGSTASGDVDSGPSSADRFEAVGTNPFVAVGHDPLSTFAADVDTASYEWFRTSMQGGVLPNKDSVRLEEFVNYFAYDYESPSLDAEHPFSIHLAAAPNLVSRDTHLLRVGIQGKEVPADSEKKPANLVFLVDISGSMSGQLPMVQAVLRETVDLLEPTDTLSIVTYAGDVGTLLGATPVSQTEEIQGAIDSLVSGGSTNGAGGINAAYAQAESAFIDGGINHVLLCTDGDFNVGISDTNSLEELIIEKRKTGVTLTALGFGSGNYNDAMMERISNAGNGIYGYIGSASDAEKYVQERMLQTLVHIAKDMKLQVEFNPEHVYAYRLLGYENRDIADDDFRDDVVDAGEIGNGHRVTAIYELVFQESDMPAFASAPALDDGDAYAGETEVAPEDLVLVKVRYKQPGATEEDPALEVASSLAPADVLGGFEGAASDLQWAAAVAAFAEVLKQSPYADAKSLAAMRLVFAAQAERDDDRAEFLSLFDKAVDLLEATTP